MAFMPAAAALVSSLPKPTLYPIACNSYNWVTFYGRKGKNWGENLVENIEEFAKTGITAYEPGIENLAMVQRLIPILKKNNIAMPSVYVNSVLHEESAVNESIKSILEIAKEVKKYGTKIIVTNPSPIKWGSPELKNDAQLAVQAQAMETLGSRLRQMGITLAYHTHDVELKAGAREFHHIMLNTSAQNVSFCFDVHWVYRGSGNSQLAVFDVLKLYGNRIVELHLRQSVAGIWSETFTAKGDIDFARFALELKKMKLRPHLVIEQCIEANSPNTMDAISAHMKDLEAIKTTFQI